MCCVLRASIGLRWPFPADLRSRLGGIPCLVCAHHIGGSALPTTRRRSAGTCSVSASELSPYRSIVVASPLHHRPIPTELEGAGDRRASPPVRRVPARAAATPTRAPRARSLVTVQVEARRFTAHAPPLDAHAVRVTGPPAVPARAPPAWRTWPPARGTHRKQGSWPACWASRAPGDLATRTRGVVELLPTPSTGAVAALLAAVGHS